MNEKYLSKFSVTSSIAASVIAFSQLGLVAASNASTFKIVCNTRANNPTIVANFTGSQSKEAKLLTFLPEYFPQGEAKHQCQTTATTLQAIYTSSEMNYLASDTVNEHPVVCAVERRGVGCDSYNAHVLFAFDRQVNPAMALYKMLGEDFKQSKLPDIRTVSRIYTELNPPWWRWSF